jgi:hypothetical protein
LPSALRLDFSRVSITVPSLSNADKPLSLEYDTSPFTGECTTTPRWSSFQYLPLEVCNEPDWPRGNERGWAVTAKEPGTVFVRGAWP